MDLFDELENLVATATYERPMILLLMTQRKDLSRHGENDLVTHMIELWNLLELFDLQGNSR